MPDRWLLIDEMVTELGDVYALEVEAAGYPELASDPALKDVHLAVLRATEAMAAPGHDPGRGWRPARAGPGSAGRRAGRRRHRAQPRGPGPGRA